MSSTSHPPNGHRSSPLPKPTSATPPPRPRPSAGIPSGPAHRSALSVSITPTASSASRNVRSPPLSYAEADSQPGDPLGDLTPTSNPTPTPPTPDSPTPESPPSSGYSSSASSIMSLPPLSISPHVLESLQRQLVEKSELLNLANDHISHQSVQIQHLQAKLQSYQHAHTAVLTAVEGAGSGVGRGEEVKQLRVLVSHLHGMLAARDEVIAEQDKELGYWQQQIKTLKEAREKDVERVSEAERERDRDRDRIRLVEAELVRLRERERERKERGEERRDQQLQQPTAERRTHSEEEPRARHRVDPPVHEEQKALLQPPHPASAPPPVSVFRAQSEPVTAPVLSSTNTAAAVVSPPPISVSPVNASALSPSAAGGSPGGSLSPFPGRLGVGRGLLPKVRRSAPSSARQSPTLMPSTNGAATPPPAPLAEVAGPPSPS